MKRLACLVVVVAAACGSSSPANVAGDYSISGTNRTDGCGIGWTVANTFTGVQVTITQQGSTASATVMGGGGFTLAVLLGTNSFTGSVDGNTLDLKATGTAAKQSGNCTYTYNSEIKASISGDALTGRIDYRAATNGNSDCAALTGCDSYQDINGTRPPM